MRKFRVTRKLIAKCYNTTPQRVSQLIAGTLLGPDDFYYPEKIYSVLLTRRDSPLRRRLEDPGIRKQIKISMDSAAFRFGLSLNQ